MSRRGLLARIRQHLAPSALKEENHKNCWLKQLLTEGLKPKGVVIQELQTHEILAQAEIFWIAYFKQMGCPLTNHCLGGEGFSGIFTPRHRQNLALARLTRSERQRQVLLRLLASDEHATDLDLGRRMGLKPRMVRKHLKELRNSGMIAVSVKRHLTAGSQWMNYRTAVVTAKGYDAIRESQVREQGNSGQGSGTSKRDPSDDEGVF